MSDQVALPRHLRWWGRLAEASVELILNPEEETHAKDAMHAKEGIYERDSTHHWGDTFSI